MKVLGKFRLIRGLGRGGMGEVFLAEDTEAGREVALKLILGASAANEALVKRFRREIQVCSRLRHPNIVRIFDHGVTGGRRYFAMQYIPGRPLDVIIKDSGPLLVPALFDLAAQMGAALETLHDAGVIHRDIKPGNIMRASAKTYVLMDFGLAKVTDATQLTKTGKAIGTPLMSPEMIMGKTVTPASDVYQLGLVLYNAAAGQLPFPTDGSFATFLEFLVDGDLPPLSDFRDDLPPGLDAVVRNAACPRIDCRYESMEIFLEDLARARRGESVVPLQPLSVDVACHEEHPSRKKKGDGGARHGEKDHTVVLDRSSGSIAADAERGRASSTRIEPITSARWMWLASGLIVAAVVVAGLVLRLTSGVTSTAALRKLEVTAGVRSARVQWETSEPVLPWLKYRPRGVGQWAKYRALKAARHHDAILADLEPGVLYAVRAVMPGGRESLDREFRCAARLEASIPDAHLGKSWPPRLVWTTDPPSRCTLRYRHRGRTVQGKAETVFARKHGFFPIAWNPLYPLEDVVVTCETVEGKRIVTRPAVLHGLPGRWVAATERLRPGSLWRALKARLQAYDGGKKGRDPTAAVMAELRRLGCGDAYRRFLPLAPTFFADLGQSPQRKAKVYGALLEALRVDQFCHFLRLKPALRVRSSFRPFVVHDERSLLREPLPKPVARHEFPRFLDHFFPVNAPPEALRKWHAVNVNVSGKVKKKPFSRFFLRFALTAAALAKARDGEVSFKARQMFTNYYMEIVVNGRLRLLVHNPRSEDDPANRINDTFLGDAELSIQSNWRTYFVRFDPAFLKEGDNEISLAQYTMTGVEGWLTPVRFLEVKLQ